MLQELKELPQWVVRFADKLPLRPIDGNKASVTNPNDWTDYETAKACCVSNPSLGLGFVLTEQCPYSLIDLDDPFDPKNGLTAEAANTILEHQKQISNAFETYQEVSPSGRGLHIIVRGKVPTGKRRQCVEVYSSGRYMTVTEQPYRDVPIADCQGLLDRLYADMGGQADSVTSGILSGPETRSDQDVCRLAASGANGNGEKFTALYERGDFQGIAPTPSEADLILCNILAFYSDSPEQVARIFRASALANLSLKRKQKTAREDYLYHPRWGILTKAFDRKQPAIDLSKMATKLHADIFEHEETPSFHDWTTPPGLVGQISEFIYSNAVNPVKEVAIAASIAFLAGICGRAYNYSNTGLNQYMVLLANSGGGKEGASQGMDRLTRAVLEQVPAFGQFIGPSNIASPQALVKQFQESPCFISHIEEIGHFLQKICGKYAKGNEVEFRGALLKLYSKSGAGQDFKATVYSDKAKNVPTVRAPALTIFGDSTHREFYKALDEDNIAEGLVSRLTVIEANDRRPPFNKLANVATLSPELVWRLSSLAKRCLELEQLKQTIHIAETDEAKEMHLAFREYCADKVYGEDRDKPVASIWSRAHLRVLRLAGLLAVGANFDSPIVTAIEIEWAKDLIIRGIEMVSKRFENGEVGQTSYSLEQSVAVKRFFRRYTHLKWEPEFEKRYGFTKDMLKAHVCTHRYVQISLSKLACFRNDRSPILALRNAIDEMVNSGLIEKIDLSKVRDSRKKGIGYRLLED